MNVAIFVCVAQAYSLTQRPKMFTYISTAWVLPSFVGPPASAWLTEHLSWHWVFLAVIPLVLFGGAMALPSLLRMMRSHQPITTDASSLRHCGLPGSSRLPRPPCNLLVSGWTGSRSGLVVGGLAVLLVALPRLMPPGFLRFRRGLSQVIQTRGLLAGAFVGG